MAGLSKETPLPTEIKLHKQSKILDVTFSDGKTFHFTCEFLRVHSPSAAVQGHSPEQGVLQTGNSNLLKIKGTNSLFKNLVITQFGGAKISINNY